MGRALATEGPAFIPIRIASISAFSNHPDGKSSFLATAVLTFALAQLYDFFR